MKDFTHMQREKTRNADTRLGDLFKVNGIYNWKGEDNILWALMPWSRHHHQIDHRSISTAVTIRNAWTLYMYTLHVHSWPMCQDQFYVWILLIRNLFLHLFVDTEFSESDKTVRRNLCRNKNMLNCGALPVAIWMDSLHILKKLWC
jgi:hypothetical protein